jgi:hypothetical protein
MQREKSAWEAKYPRAAAKAKEARAERSRKAAATRKERKQTAKKEEDGEAPATPPPKSRTAARPEPPGAPKKPSKKKGAAAPPVKPRDAKGEKRKGRDGGEESEEKEPRRKKHKGSKKKIRAEVEDLKARLAKSERDMLGVGRDILFLFESVAGAKKGAAPMPPRPVCAFCRCPVVEGGRSVARTTCGAGHPFCLDCAAMTKAGRLPCPSCSAAGDAKENGPGVRAAQQASGKAEEEEEEEDELFTHDKWAEHWGGDSEGEMSDLDGPNKTGPGPAKRAAGRASSSSSSGDRGEAHKCGVCLEAYGAGDGPRAPMRPVCGHVLCLGCCCDLPATPVEGDPTPRKRCPRCRAPFTEAPLPLFF